MTDVFTVTTRQDTKVYRAKDSPDQAARKFFVPEQSVRFNITVKFRCFLLSKITPEKKLKMDGEVLSAITGIYGIP